MNTEMKKYSPFSKLYEKLEKRKKDNMYKPKPEHPEFCKCENCTEELNKYNKRNNTTYETEFTW